MPPDQPAPLVILQLLPALEAGGVERGTIEIARALVQRGHRSIVISAGGGLVNRLLAEGSEHIALPVGRKSFFTLRHIPVLRKIIVEKKVSVVHARSRLPAWIGYLAWKGMDAGMRPRFVTTVHGPYTVNAYSRIMMRGECIIAISEFILKYIAENYPGVDKGKIRLIYRGVSPDEFPYGYRPSAGWLSDWRRQNPYLPGKYIVTMPARITRWKGHEDFIEIISAAKSRGIPVHGLIAGAPHPRKKSFYNQLIKSIKNLAHPGDITLLGHRDDLREVISVSNVILSLAREPEAFGRTILESLCLGRPVIAYDHGGATEILKAIFPAGLVKPLDKLSVVTKLEDFYKNNPVVPDHNPFTLEAMLQQTLSLYEELTAHKH
jgi:Glycosyltransferase